MTHLENQVRQFKGENFSLWKFQFRLLLEQNQLLDIVDGKEIKPEAHVHPRTEIRDRNWHVVATIFDARMSSSEDVSSYIAKIENLSARIQDAGGTITDDQKVAKIINSLPSSMPYFIPAWESQAPITQTLENLSARLLIEECRNQQADSSQGTAFYQQIKPRIKEDNIKKTDSGKISELKKKTECHYCHKIGHWSRECRKRIADQQKKNEKRKNQAGDCDHKGFNADTILKWNDCDIWWADSGASCSMTFRREWFKSFTPIHNDHRIYLGDNTSVLAEGTGDIEILAMGYRVDIDKDELRIYSRKDLKAVGQRQDGLYKMMFRVTSSSQGFSAKINNLQLWHERLAHISLTTIREMAKKGLINGLQPEDIKEDDFFCQGCQEGKAHRKPSHLSETKEYNPGEFILSDICGPMPTQSIGGSLYCILFKDYSSGFRHIDFIRHKSDILHKFENFSRFSYNQTGNKIEVIRTDNALEYTSKDFTNTCRKFGIVHELSAPYVHEQIGRVERDNITIVEAARSMLCARNLPEELWAEACNTATFILNRTFTKQAPNTTPYELFFGRKVSLYNLKIFGSEAWLHTLKERRRKWDKKSQKMIFLDQCVFTGTINDTQMILALYVDDGLLMSRNKDDIDSIVQELSHEFNITSRDADYFVGLQIEQSEDRSKIYIHQSSYINKILDKFNMIDCKPAAVPMDPSTVLTKADCPDLDKNGNSPKFPYREAVGSLMFAYSVSRPDIAFATSQLSKYLDNPGQTHWTAIKSVFRYLKATPQLGILYASHQELTGYSDSDYARDIDSRKSTTGYIFMLNHGAVMFRLLLEQNQLLDIVDGKEIKPEVSDATSAIQDAWHAKDIKARMLISQALELRFLEPLMSCKTAAQMWTRLMSIHEQRSEIAIGMLWQQFFDARMSSSEDVSSYIAKIENLSARIQDAGGTITDDQKVAKIINSLPSSMPYFIPAWESQAPITQTLENLSARLLIEECRNQQADSSQGTAFYQQIKPRIKEDNIKKTDSGKISELKKKTECHYCHKIGHWSRECRKRIADQQKKNEKRKNQAGDCDHKGFNADTILKWNDCDIWWADSGASCSMTFRREWFKSFTPIHNDHRIYLGDNTSVLAEGTGDIEILAMGYRVDIDKDELRIYSRKDLKAVGQRQDGLYKMMFRVTSSSQGFSAKINNLQLWHERLAHISLTTIREMAKKGLINGLQPEDIKEDDFFCQGCQEGKAHRKPSHLSETKEYNPGEFILSDICGPMPTQSIGGSLYCILFKDYSSGFRHIDFIRHKSDILHKFENFARFSYNQTGNKIEVIRTDNALEYTSKDFTNTCRKFGIVHELSAPYVHEQIGRVERDNITIVEAARSMLCARNLPEELWAEACNTATFILNRTFTKQAPNTTPYELFFGRKVSLYNLKIFGSEAWLHTLKERRRKWDKKSQKMIFLDQCVFTGTINDTQMILALYVDDGLLMSRNKDDIDSIVQELSHEFNITSRDADYFVGLQIEQSEDRSKIYIHQSSYINKILDKFNMIDCKPAAVPMDPSTVLTKADCPDLDKNGNSPKFPYREAVGSLMFAYSVSRPDIAFATSQLSKYLDNPGQTHWTAIKSVFRYLKATPQLGILYASHQELTGYSDSDYARDIDSRKSTTGERKQTRNSLSLSVKLQILREIEVEKKKKTDVAQKHNIPQSSLSTIIKNSEKIHQQALHAGESSRKRARGSTYADVDEALLQWFKQARSAALPVNGPLLSEKAKTLALEFGLKDFTGSGGWIERWKARHGIKLRNICGESADVNRETMTNWLTDGLEMDFDSYADADNDVVTNAMLSDVEIVESILQAKEEEETDQVDEEVDPIVHIPHPKEVLESIQTLRLFLQCQDESKSLHRHLSDLDNIEKSVQHLLLTSKCDTATSLQAYSCCIVREVKRRTDLYGVDLLAERLGSRTRAPPLRQSGSTSGGSFTVAAL
ncbi:hypothetical protein LAZ67_1002068, partial [Cordylochernes scorpioides]